MENHHIIDIEDDDYSRTGVVRQRKEGQILKVVGASWTQIRITIFILASTIIFGILIIIFETLEEPPRVDNNYAATVFWRRQNFHVQPIFWGQGNELQEVPLGAARAYFRIDTRKTGWSVLEIETNPIYPDHIQAYAAGFIEAALTWSVIHQHWRNTVKVACDKHEKECENIRKFLNKSDVYVRDNIEKLSRTNQYWHQISLFYKQLDGIRAGFQYSLKRNQLDDQIHISLSDFLWLNIISDVNDLEQMFGLKRHPELEEMPSMTSAFLKIVNSTDGKMIHIAHNTANSYNYMFRMQKHYKFGYHYLKNQNSGLVPGNSVSFTSYPGSISSQDDFYVIKSSHDSISAQTNLIVTSTPLKIYNKQLWGKIWESKKKTILMAPRIMAANRLAIDSESWAQWLEEGGTGTGNKQWLIVDLNKLDSASYDDDDEDKFSDLLWVVEQVPGLMRASDQSKKFINQTYWGSFGIPFYEEIYKASGINDKLKYASEFLFESSTRAAQIRQYQNNCTTAKSVFELMRNASNSDNIFSLSLRGDLLDKPVPYGVIDTKIVTGTSKGVMDFNAISGPPYSVKNNQDTNSAKNKIIPPFKWSSSAFKNQSHIGFPDLWEFQPVQIEWVWN